MNKILIGLNVVLAVLVGWLFYKVNGLGKTESNEKESANESAKTENPKPAAATVQKGSTPTGKIAYVNIDRLNEESLEIEALMSELKRRKMSIEASMETLNMEYQKKVEDYQTSAKAGIAPESELMAKAKYIQSIEKQAQNKQLQMDDLSQDISSKNESFQKNIRAFLVEWNEGRYDYILSYSEAVPTMLLGNTSLEVTNEVISELNKIYKEKSKGKK
jgi:outer membrane protein